MLSKKSLWISGIILLILTTVVGLSIYFESSNGDYYPDEEESSYPQDTQEAGLISNTTDGTLALSAPGDDRKTTTNPSATQERLIIKTGNFSIIVDDVKQIIDKITSYTNQHAGFVVSSTINKYDIGLTGNITIRIPSKDMDQAVMDLKALGEVSSESVYGNDVTEEYVDLDARLKNLKATEAQFQEIMKQAVKIEDVLAVEKELSRTRSEIEAITGKLKYLKESSDLSTLTFYISTNSENLPILDKGDRWKPFGVLKDAFRSVLDLAKGIGTGLIWALVYLPIAAIIGLIIWWIVRVAKRKLK